VNLPYSSRLTAEQVTFSEDNVLTYAVAGFSTQNVTKIGFNHPALGAITVQVGWVYKFVLKNVEMHMIVIGLEAYTSARKYVLFSHMYAHIHPNLHLDTAFWGLR